MIYLYEQAVLEYFHGCFKDLKLMTYASDIAILSAMTQVQQYPSMYYTRSDDNMTNGKLYQVNEKDGSFMNISPYIQTYKAYILVENQAQAFMMCARLRAYWNRYSKVWITYDSIGTISVQLRLKYIKTTEARRPDDTKGACRIIEVEWESTLFLDDSAEKLAYPLVESYSFSVNGNNVGISQEHPVTNEGVHLTINALDKTPSGEIIIVDSIDVGY